MLYNEINTDRYLAGTSPFNIHAPFIFHKTVISPARRFETTDCSWYFSLQSCPKNPPSRGFPMLTGLIKSIGTQSLGVSWSSKKQHIIVLSSTERWTSINVELQRSDRACKGTRTPICSARTSLVKFWPQIPNVFTSTGSLGTIKHVTNSFKLQIAWRNQWHCFISFSRYKYFRQNFPDSRLVQCDPMFCSDGSEGIVGGFRLASQGKATKVIENVSLWRMSM